MGKQTLQGLAGVLMEKNGLNKQDAIQFVSAIFDVIQYGLLKDRQVKIKGLGTFKLIDVEARESVNVNTGEHVIIESHSKITFTPDTAMKELVNKPFSGFETVVLNDGVTFDDMPSIILVDEPEDNEEAIVESEQETVPNTIGGEAAETEPALKESGPASEPETAGPEPEPETVGPEPEPETAGHEPDDSAVEALPGPLLDILPDEHPADVVEEAVPTDDPVTDGEKEDTDETEEKTEMNNSESQNIINDKPMEEETFNDDYGMHTKQKSHKWLWPLICVLGCLVSFGVGYRTSQVMNPLSSYVDIDTVLPMDSVEDSIPVVDKQEKTAVVAKEEPKASEAKETKKETKEVKNAKETAKPDSLDYLKYEEMDARVRTGAYRIVGTDRVIKTKPGETLGYISGRTLGPDMSCYIEVYNNIKGSTKVLEPGTEIKIPKLELKKKSKKTSSKN